MKASCPSIRPASGDRVRRLRRIERSPQAHHHHFVALSLEHEQGRVDPGDPGSATAGDHHQHHDGNQYSILTKADVGEARSVTNQAVLYGYTPLVPWGLIAWPMPTTGPPETTRERHRHHQVVVLA